MGNSVLGKNIGEVKPYNVSPTDPNYIPPTASSIATNTNNNSPNNLANEGIKELMRRFYNGTSMSWRPETRNYKLGNIYDYIGTGEYITESGNNWRWGGEMNSSNDPYSAAKAKADASGGKYLVGYYKPENWYYLYDNPEYIAPQQQATNGLPYATTSYGNPVNNGTTAGTMTSAITLDPHQQYLLNQQNAAKEQLTNALADYAGNIFNSAYRPDQNDATRLRTFAEVRNEPNKIDLSGAYSNANDFVNRASGVYNAAADQYLKLLESGYMPTSDTAYRKQIQDALMDYQESRLNPTYSKQSRDLAARLANQGITQGSDTYDLEWDIYDRAKNDAYQSAYNHAITLGEQAIHNQFNRDMQTYQQYANNYDLAAKYRDIASDNLNDVYKLDVQQNSALNNTAIGLMGAYQNNQQLATSTRQQQMNELMALMQLTAPTMPQFSHQNTSGNIAAGDYIGAATGLYGGLGSAAANGAASAQAAQQSQNNLLGDIIGAAGMFLL